MFIRFRVEKKAGKGVLTENQAARAKAHEPVEKLIELKWRLVSENSQILDPPTTFLVAVIPLPPQHFCSWTKLTPPHNIFWSKRPPYNIFVIRPPLLQHFFQSDPPPITF